MSAIDLDWEEIDMPAAVDDSDHVQHVDLVQGLHAAGTGDPFNVGFSALQPPPDGAVHVHVPSHPAPAGAAAKTSAAAASIEELVVDIALSPPVPLDPNPAQQLNNPSPSQVLTPEPVVDFVLTRTLQGPSTVEQLQNHDHMQGHATAAAEGAVCSSCTLPTLQVHGADAPVEHAEAYVEEPPAQVQVQQLLGHADEGEEDEEEQEDSKGEEEEEAIDEDYEKYAERYEDEVVEQMEEEQVEEEQVEEGQEREEERQEEEQEEEQEAEKEQEEEEEQEEEPLLLQEEEQEEKEHRHSPCDQQVHTPSLAPQHRLHSPVTAAAKDELPAALYLCLFTVVLLLAALPAAWRAAHAGPHAARLDASAKLLLQWYRPPQGCSGSPDGSAAVPGAACSQAPSLPPPPADTLQFQLSTDAGRTCMSSQHGPEQQLTAVSCSSGSSLFERWMGFKQHQLFSASHGLIVSAVGAKGGRQCLESTQLRAGAAAFKLSRCSAAGAGTRRQQWVFSPQGANSSSLQISPLLAPGLCVETASGSILSSHLLLGVVEQKLVLARCNKQAAQAFAPAYVYEPRPAAAP